VVGYWRGARLYLYCVATRRAVAVNERVFAVLEYFARRRSPEALLSRASPPSARLLRAVIDRLVTCGLLVAEDGETTVEDKLDDWGPWNPVASFFHMAI
jgi:hypothetical protein